MGSQNRRGERDTGEVGDLAGRAGDRRAATPELYVGTTGRVAPSGYRRMRRMMAHGSGGLSRWVRERVGHHSPRILAFVTWPNLVHWNQGKMGPHGCDWPGWGFHRETADLLREHEHWCRSQLGAYGTLPPCRPRSRRRVMTGGSGAAPISPPGAPTRPATGRPEMRRGCVVG